MRSGLLCVVLAVWGCGAAPPPVAPKAIDWVHDDHPGALATAKATGKPLVIDFWAPWCHTCLSMKHTVLADPAIAALGDRFVWLAVDTDRPANAAVVERLPIDFWPTFFVLDPKDETVQARHVGAASVDQFRAFLKRGEAGVLAEAELRADDPLRFVRDGDRAVQAEDLAAADAAYARAFEQAPADWARAPEVLVAWAGVKHDREDWAGCLALGEARLDEAARGRTGSAADFASFVGECAAHVEAERAQAFRRRAVAMIDALLADPAAPLAVDDRSEALRIQRGMLEALGEADAARAKAVAQRDLLATAWAAAEAPFARMTFAWPRAEVHVHLGEGAALVPDLQQLAAALPDQYDPPYRLAWVLLKLDRRDEARDAAQQAVERAYGPRKGRAWKLLADVQAARGDAAGQRAALQAWVDHERGLPPAMRSAKRLEQAEAALAAAP